MKMIIKSQLRKKAYQYLLTNRAAALATVDKKGTPHVATIFFIPRKNLSLYFITKTTGRKFQNLMGKPRVAMAITDEKKLTTIQLTGIAERVTNVKLEQEILQDLWLFRHRNLNWPIPPLKLYETGEAEELAVIKVKPSEMTYASFEISETSKYKSFFQKVL